MITKHRHGDVVPLALLKSIGCTLTGRRCVWSGQPYGKCQVGVPAETLEIAKTFCSSGFYSFPCFNEVYCGNWLFWVAREFDDIIQRRSKIESQGWYWTGYVESTINEYCACPCCSRAYDPYWYGQILQLGT